MHARKKPQIISKLCLSLLPSFFFTVHFWFVLPLINGWLIKSCDSGWSLPKDWVIDFPSYSLRLINNIIWVHLVHKKLLCIHIFKKKDKHDLRSGFLFAILNIVFFSLLVVIFCWLWFVGFHRTNKVLDYKTIEYENMNQIHFKMQNKINNEMRKWNYKLSLISTFCASGNER